MYIPCDELVDDLVDSDSSRTVRVKKISAKHDNVHTEYTKENIEVHVHLKPSNICII